MSVAPVAKTFAFNAIHQASRQGLLEAYLFGACRLKGIIVLDTVFQAITWIVSSRNPAHLAQFTSLIALVHGRIVN